MRLLCLTCEVLARATYLCAASSPHIVDVELYRHGLHNNPADLRSRLQARIDAASAESYDAILLGYGLCGLSIAGLRANSHPLVIPRAHDCITLFLGGRDRYDQQFREQPGTYWFAQDYMERADGSGSGLALGASGADDEKTYAEYVRKFGVENADYLMQVMGAWQQHYQRAAYVDLGVGDGAATEAKAQATAEQRGWAFDSLAGDMVLVRRLIYGDWGEDFLVVEPGNVVATSYDREVIGCLPDPTRNESNSA